MRFSIFQDTALGARSVNQDRMGYCFTRDSLLMLLADGMGGHLRGEVAAQLAIQTAAAAFQESARPMVADPVGFLDHALRSAHREIMRYQEAHGLPESPRTTVVPSGAQSVSRSRHGSRSAYRPSVVSTKLPASTQETCGGVAASSW